MPVPSDVMVRQRIGASHAVTRTLRVSADVRRLIVALGLKSPPLKQFLDGDWLDWEQNTISWPIFFFTEKKRYLTPSAQSSRIELDFAGIELKRRDRRHGNDEHVPEYMPEVD